MARSERPARSAVGLHEVKGEASIMEQSIGAELVNPAAGNGTPGAVTLDINAARGLPSTTWLNRSLKIEYADAHGSDQETSDVYLDHCPDGLVTNTKGAWTPSGWERLCAVELAGA
jgi:hypothetical protein